MTSVWLSRHQLSLCHQKCVFFAQKGCTRVCNEIQMLTKQTWFLRHSGTLSPFHENDHNHHPDDNTDQNYPHSWSLYPKRQFNLAFNQIDDEEDNPLELQTHVFTCSIS